MNLEQQVANLDLSKKLKALGVKQESIFYWEYYDEQCYAVKYFPFCVVPDSHNKFQLYSAFTASELSLLMPHHYAKDEYTHFIDTTACTMPDGEYFTICRSHFYFNEDDGCEVVGVDFDGDGNEANARAMMLIYLIENSLMEAPSCEKAEDKAP